MAGLSGIEKRKVTLGFVPLTDCAPLVVAREKGFFERHGVDVELSREASWSTIRDKVSVEAIDGGQMLAAMPLAATLGLGGFRTPMVVGLSMNLNGNSVTLSTGLWAEIEPHATGPLEGAVAIGIALRHAIEQRASRLQPRLRFAVTFPYSSHNYLLRYWLSSAGIDPDRDVRLVVVPPPRMVEHLLDGAIDGYCVGAPWGQRAVDLGVGRVVLSTHEIWNCHPEKVFGTTRSWAERNPNTHQALVMALIEACRWLDVPANRSAAARLVATPGYVDAPVELVSATLEGQVMVASGQMPRTLPDFHVFFRYAATFPWRSHALWSLAQMCRWGQLSSGADLEATADAVYRPDIYRAAARRLGIAAPDVDYKTEGTHPAIHTLTEGAQKFALGPDLLCDGAVFDPTDPVARVALAAPQPPAN
ncbi:MAG: ABC transporter substrate-binding protein [Rhodospirillales bacterium]|nr:ABC transporter substrate-binding protein [Rhodospirillales bacterium]